MKVQRRGRGEGKGQSEGGGYQTRLLWARAGNGAARVVLGGGNGIVGRSVKVDGGQVMWVNRIKGPGTGPEKEDVIHVFGVGIQRGKRSNGNKERRN